jgi:hypothetical protein
MAKIVQDAGAFLREIVPNEPRVQPRSDLRRRTFATALSLPVMLVGATIILLGLWALLSLALVFALLACAALVAIGLPICILLAKRTWRRRFPPSQP